MVTAEKFRIRQLRMSEELLDDIQIETGTFVWYYISTK